MTAPSRRRPGSASPIRLVAEVEEVRTSNSAATAITTPVTVAEARPVAHQEDRDVDPRPIRPAMSDEKRPVTFGIRISLKKRAETAVLRTAGYEGGYTSMAALLDGALERELERLAAELNNGEPFPPNLGGFRQGRPLGS